MKDDNLDGETKAQLSKAQALDAMFASSGWKYAEQEMMDLITALNDISTLDVSGDIAAQVKERRLLTESLIEWVDTLKSQVNNAIIVEQAEDNGLIVRR